MKLFKKKENKKDTLFNTEVVFFKSLEYYKKFIFSETKIKLIFENKNIRLEGTLPTLSHTELYKNEIVSDLKKLLMNIKIIKL